MPASIEEIYRILESPDWTYEEKLIVRWQFKVLRILGDFEEHLLDTIALADEANLSRLELGFPEEVNAYRMWAYGDLGRRLREAGLGI